MALTETQKLQSGKAYKVYYNKINIRQSNSAASSDIGDLKAGNYYFYYTEIKKSSVSGVNDNFIKLASGQANAGNVVGWVAMSSGSSTYISTDSSSYPDCYDPYYTTEISGSAFAKYYYPDFGTTTYKLQGTDTRYEKSFNIRSSPGNNTIKNTETDIVLTINYNNGNANDSQTGKTWTETTYNFLGWDESTSSTSPGMTSGTVDCKPGVSRTTLNDYHYHAVYKEGNTSDPQYSNHTVTLTNPTKDDDTSTYEVKFDANGGSISTTSTFVTKKTVYEFSKWTGSTGVTINGTTCTFKQTGTVTANYNPTTTPAKVASMPIPTKPGYEFLGWGISADQTTDLIAGGESSPEINSNITYIAIWKVKGTIRIYVEEDQRYRMALPYLHDGARWRMAIPYLHNGTKYYIVAG